MKWFLRGSLAVLALAGIAGMFALLAWFANEWVVSALASTAVLAWLAGWLVIAYGKDRLRAVAIGAVVAGAVYWLLAMGPWFQAHIGSTLLTSRLLAWVEATHRQPVVSLGSFTTVDLGTIRMTGVPGSGGPSVFLNNSGLVTATPQFVVTTNPPALQLPLAMSAFQAAGHWSFAWLFALAGGIVVAVLQRQARGNSPSPKEAAS